MPADRPIIFSAPMVRALLDGRKTQTRRLAWRDRAHRDGQSPAPSPWQSVRPGDRLFVREAVRADEHEDEDIVGVRYLADDLWCPLPNTDQWRERHHIINAYRSDDPDLNGGKAVPPIHMPRWASRLTLHVEAVRVERLQDISEENALAEGLACISKDGGRVYKWGLPDRDGYPGRDDDGWPWTMWCVGHKPAFAALWDSLHGSGAWQRNPEVVVITFRVERGNIDRDARDA